MRNASNIVDSGLSVLDARATSDVAADGIAKSADGTSTPDVTDVQLNGDADLSVTASAATGVTAVTVESALSVLESECPCFKVLDQPATLVQGKGSTELLSAGVWYFSVKSGKDEAPSALTHKWICTPLHINAVTYDAQEGNFGRLLRFSNTLGHWCQWAMPMQMLRSSGEELRGELLAMGLHIDPDAHRLLMKYLHAVKPTREVQCATQVGWCDDCFVLPDTVIGPNAANKIFQSGERDHSEYAVSGTLDGWKSGISALATGNPFLTLALSASFAGPLLARCNAESGGLHFVGNSSTGKTTLIEAACAIWGSTGFKRSWRATANGMEGAAVLANDSLLALDEIGECDPKDVGTIVYALGNGCGKQRASRTGAARGIARWRCIVLSSGERTLTTTMMEGGQRTKAGQSVRLLDIPAECPDGIWDELHGFATGAALSDAIKQAAATHYGHAGRAFLEELTRDTRDFRVLLQRIKSLSEFSAAEGAGQDKRAAARLAQVALAGELATEYGITGWGTGAAIKAAADAYKAWLSLRNPGNDEPRQIAEQLAIFIESHGDGRFSRKGSNVPVPNRAGWWCEDDQGGRIYLITRTGMREALKGWDFKRALNALGSIGAFSKAREAGERSKPERIEGQLVRVYAISLTRLNDDRGD